MNKTERLYLMLGGTFLPAFLLAAGHVAYHKRGTFKTSDLLMFALGSAVGGYLTAKMLENIQPEVQLPEETQSEETQ